MNVGEFLEKGGQLTVVILEPDFSKYLEMASRPTHGNKTPCFSPDCDCREVYAARMRVERAGLLIRGKRGGFRQAAPRRTRA